ncbi:hypothetical protein TNCT_202131 [Trichonephila clavata]|uniref:Uncharacterized protein n=1 Tax=Trichonephila clavata TaxID=2740835 RepID=A0A8X6K9H1_TRICU|nr:hypothetical protein TNCT_202131 [Trichonephila clavata]
MAEKVIVTALKKKRTQLRTAVTKLINTIEEEIEKPNVNYEEVEVNIELLEDKFQHLSTTDDGPIKHLRPEDVVKELISSEGYRDKIVLKTVCLPSSKVAVPITPMAPEDCATVRLSDENKSPVRAGRVINGQDETIPDVSLSVTLTDLVPVFPLIIQDDPEPTFPLTFLEDPEPDGGDHNDPSPNNRSLKTKFIRVVWPVLVN